MKYFLFIIFLFFTQLSFSQKVTSVKGVVKDAETQIPIAGATVVIYCQDCGDTAISDPASKLTDASGAYEFKNFKCRKSCASFIVKVSKKDYLGNEQFSSKWNENTVLNFSMFSTAAKPNKPDNNDVSAKPASTQQTITPSPGLPIASVKTDSSKPSAGTTNSNKGNKVLGPGATILLSDGTSAQVFGTDTVNRIDVENFLQGKWIFPGKYAAGKLYDSNGYFMEGNFIENKKTGNWLKYFPNDTIAFTLAYKNDIAGGAFNLYYQNGILKSRGYYVPGTKEFKGAYFENYPSGHVFKKFDYDSAGAKSGLQYLYYPNQNISIMATMKNNLLEGQTIVFFDDGAIYAQRQYSLGKLIKEVIIAHDRKITANVIDTLMATLSAPNTGVVNELDKAVGEINGITSKLQDLVSERNKELALANEIINEQRRQLLIQSKHISKIELENKLQGEQISRQRIVTLLGSGLALIMLFIIIYVYRNSREKTKTNIILSTQKNEIEQKNKEITDSINYAKRIQSAMLPPKETIKTVFPESFVFFHPKEIVSGDFYWFYETNTGYLLAAADCTGHGVPGGFMSMIGSEKLSEAAAATSDVSELLSRVNRGVKKALRQSSSSDSTRDGMDVILCYFDKQKRYLEYSAANRPLWMIKKPGAEITEIKATKNAIGGFTEDGQVFAKHRIELNKGDTVYLFSDGYADQFGTENKKLMVKRFKEKLISVQNKSLEEQGKILEEYHNNWKGPMEQTDDILVIGVRV